MITNLYNRNKQIFISVFIILLLVIYSCSGTKQTGNKTKMKSAPINLTAKYNISARTRLLIKDIETELQNKKTNLKDFIPSKELVKKYGLLKINELFYINGFILINENFNESTLNELSIKTGAESNNLITVQVPVNKFDLFLQNKGIKYFKVSEKVYKK